MMDLKSETVYAVQSAKISDFDRSFTVLGLFKLHSDAISFLQILYRMHVQRKYLRLMIDTNNGIVEINYPHKDVSFRVRRMNLYGGIE